VIQRVRVLQQAIYRSIFLVNEHTIQIQRLELRENLSHMFGIFQKEVSNFRFFVIEQVFRLEAQQIAKFEPNQQYDLNIKTR
jgi:hypothetical protein